MIPVRIALLLTVVFALTLALPLSVAFAHDGEDHSTEAEAKTHLMTASMTTAEMEQMIALLKQVIALLIEKQKMEAGDDHAHTGDEAEDHHDDEDADDHAEDEDHDDE